jgi:hypothetical protein
LEKERFEFSSQKKTSQQKPIAMATRSPEQSTYSSKQKKKKRKLIKHRQNLENCCVLFPIFETVKILAGHHDTRRKNSKKKRQEKRGI